MKLLKDCKEGDLVRFNKRGDIYKVIATGFVKTTLFNMYTEKQTEFKHYTKKGGGTTHRTVEVVDWY